MTRTVCGPRSLEVRLASGGVREFGARESPLDTEEGGPTMNRYKSVAAAERSIQ